MFTASDAYERFMGRWSRRLAPLLVDFAGVRDGESILDAGTGTGALAAAVLEAQPATRVVGVDPSPEFIADLRQRASRARASYVVGDAQNLDFADATFDRALSLLVFSFIPDPARALRELVRVTRKGGTIAAAVWDYGDGMRMLSAFWEEVAAASPEAVARHERNMPLCRLGDLEALWRASGLHDVEERPLVTELPFESFADYWEPFRGGVGPAGAYVASLAEAERAALGGRLRARLLGGEGAADRAFMLEARAWAVRGVVR